MEKNSKCVQGGVLWLTGISGAGKTTLAKLLLPELRASNYSWEYLDGDVVRSFFENDLGYTPAERALNVRRIAFAAKLLSDHGVYVLVANIAPYAEVRDFIRRKIPNYLQIYVKASLDTVRQRDPQKHYARQENGLCANLIGVDDRYDEPRTPDLVVNTEVQTPAESASEIRTLLRKKGWL